MNKKDTVIKDFQGLLRFIGFRKLMEDGMSVKLDLSDKVEQELPLGKMILKSTLHGLKSFMQNGEGQAYDEVNSQDRYELVVEMETFRSIRDRCSGMDRNVFGHGLSVYFKIEQVG